MAVRKVSAGKRLRRTPWGLYLRLAGLAGLCVLLGVILGLTIAGAVETPSAPEPEPVETFVVAGTLIDLPVIDAVPVHFEELEPPAYTDEDLETLALVIYQEAGGDACSDETRRMVGSVVLNRVESPYFPDTIQEVALQRAQYGRLYWTGLAWPERAELPQEAPAVARAYQVAEELLNGARALPGDVVYQAEFPQGTETVTEADGFYFCR